jgi:hypothetical protein
MIPVLATAQNVRLLPKVTGIVVTSDNIASLIPAPSQAAVAKALFSQPISETNITGISSSATAAQNLRGTVTFAAASTVAVVFANAEPDANYFIALSGNAAGYCWPSGYTTAGFTINCSAANSNVTDWIMVR